jgi:hypothetical protein
MERDHEGARNARDIPDTILVLGMAAKLWLKRRAVDLARRTVASWSQPKAPQSISIGQLANRKVRSPMASQE